MDISIILFPIHLSGVVNNQKVIIYEILQEPINRILYMHVSMF